MFEKQVPAPYKHYNSINHRDTLRNIDALSAAVKEIQEYLTAKETIELPIEQVETPKPAPKAKTTKTD